MSLASRDTRERAIEVWKAGQPINQICKVVGITRKTFYNWRKREADGGEQIPLPKGRPPRLLNDAHLARIRELCETNSSLYAREIRSKLGLECDLGVIYRALAELGLSYKKEIRASQRQKPEIQAEREEWLDWRKDVDPSRLVFIDETGIRTNCTPRYDWSRRGEPCIGCAPASWKSVSLVAAIRLDGVGAGSTVQGAFNKESFREYMDDLLPTLKRVDIVIMDNLSVHKNSFDIRKFKRRGLSIRYLPRYSPDLNPIENMWAKAKEIIRKIGPRTEDEIWHATNRALWVVTQSNIACWVRGCGYLH